MNEKISHEDDDETAWLCLCGNRPDLSGFATCDEAGTLIEPNIGSTWKDLYLCQSCGRIINQTTLEVVGRRELE